MTNLKDMNMLPENQWIDVCHLDDITPNTGVGALIAGQSVALFRVGNEKRIYALSNKDPFSQANVMARGIIGDLQGERVIASPIYKQHFSLATGRCLEDKDQKLSVFPTKIENGRVWVGTVPQKTYITNNGVSQEKLKLVLIGNGLAGMRCLEDLLDMAPDRYDVTVIGEEPWGNYNRIMLSPVLSGEKTIDDIMLHPHAWYSDKGIKLIADDPAVKIDRTRKVVHTQNGESVDYDRLIIATGSSPFIPPVQGVDLKGVISFRDIFDVNTMIQYAESKKNAVVIGGGLLGLEAAYGLIQRGMNVTVLHLMDRIMERQLDGRASLMLRHSIEQKGINIITEANTEALIGQDGHVSQVRLKDGTVLDADLVVFAVGIRPNIALAQSAGLRCNRGILVNDTMQTFDPSIYAVGECIEHRNQTFGLVEPLWGQAFICATHLAEHGSLTFKSPTVPTQLKVSGVDVFSAGNFEPKEDYEDIILNDEKRQIYKRIIIQKDKVIGAVLFGDTEDGMWYAELIADQTPISTFRNKLLFGKDFAMKKAG
ncbi:Nitrite reductase [NAD(P)H] large subunit [Acinetobacter haemolyticus CIP 64.3 = MTCC 9819]|uniref:Nitrite reductase [NAD(P)H], large subunit n=1 Tax=Acinetobacter haemolyticus CIP 64.3 = MTCC 9819 TaxID=1217659 RepID=N9F7R5_ACIHA|nr:nitrite reductase small subunit NirD [Acinetobacter haemolyticus]ENW18552.1 nitrite reductase [NAD(P)H], large subunit [Acinetobacter haemolyticus CIP 64.3 = MTCC 9819]EPR90294.1 Nitrite reductase [NAD(P)H] large subunit [Acinetobacter haemolyticus CIP 64.3 = MTCC 9819]NAR49530.1 nitrite reductase small subunit NirD [Acinetobacter haemolyticus]NAR97918.1 nitrite reductase small subunit NirD [Acinetobacter haemolyticus]QHI29471.1 nitrite reductase small subunit NirD [Acinetobacter haemolytic